MKKLICSSQPCCTTSRWIYVKYSAQLVQIIFKFIQQHLFSEYIFFLKKMLKRKYLFKVIIFCSIKMPPCATSIRLHTEFGPIIISKCQVSLNERNLRDSICNSEVEFSLLNTPLHSGLSFKNESYIKFWYSDNAT